MNKHYKNSFALLLNKAVTIALTLAVSILFARCLGKELLGKFNYGLSIIAFLKPIVDFGLIGMVVKEIHQAPNNRVKILRNVFTIKLCLAIIIVLGVFVFSYFSSFELKFLICILSLGLINQSFAVIQFYFEAISLGKNNLIAFSSASIISSILKIIFILNGFHINYIAILFVLDTTLASLIFVLILYRRNKSIFHDFKIDFKYIKSITSKSYLLLLSSFASIFYLKIDQIMLKMMRSYEEVGVYSIAAQISEVWYFIPATIAAGYFPKILETKHSFKDFKIEVQKLLDFLSFLSILIAVFLMFIATPLINFFYGIEFNEAATILKIHIWASVFVFSGSVFSKWILAEEKYKYSIFRHILGATFNLILNFVLIPKYGGIGAAISTIISYAVAHFFSILLLKKAKWLFLAMVKSYLVYFRLPVIIKKFKS